MAMNWADIAILVIIGISAVISLFRGFVREVLSLVAWVLAFWVVFKFSPRIAAALVDQVSLPSVRMAIAVIVLLVGTLVVVGIVNYFVGLLIDKTGLTGTDRMLGVVFGILRGVAVVTIIVVLAGLTPIPQDPWWHASLFLGHFETIARTAITWLPPDLAQHFSY